jgi:transcriptional regulator with XRE-family HTH domain
MLQNTFGSAIRRLRQAAGLSQSEFARALDVSPTYVSHLESDRREPSLQLLRKMAAKLNLPTGFLLAVALSTELTTEQRNEYGKVIETLLELATLNQLSFFEPPDADSSLTEHSSTRLGRRA